MLIDWFTVSAQVVNFLILVWLMKRFLYQPVLRAIDAREQRIAAELADADAKRTEASRERDTYRDKLAEFEQQRVTLLREATDEAKRERQRLMDEARQSSDALRAKQREALLGDAKNLNQALSRRAQQEVFAIARQTLTDLAATSLEERVVAVFIRRLQALADPEKSALRAALKPGGSDPAMIRSAFELPAAQRAAIQQAVNATFSADVVLAFETAPDLIGGLELAANGQKIAWSIADYLKSLERGVGELLQESDNVGAEKVSAGRRP